MKNRYLPGLALWFLGTLICLAQSADILRVEFTRLPKNSSDIQVSRWRFLINLPVPLGADQYLITGAEYNQIDFDNFGDLPFDSSELQILRVIDLNLGYVFQWNENWRFVGIMTPRLASNFVEGVEGDDLKLNMTASLLKDHPDGEKPFRLVLGLTFNSATGLPFPLPLINYYRRFDPHWAYVLGIPKSSFRHYFNERNMVETSVFLDGYFVNIQNDILLDDGGIGSSISLSAFIGACEYQYKITKRLSFNMLGGYAFLQNGLLRDNKRTKVYVLNNHGNLYLRTGFKVSIF